MPAAFAHPPSRWQRALIPMVTFVTVVLVFACLYWAKTVLVPLALAFLLTFILAPPVMWLQRHGWKRGPAVLLVILVAVGLTLGLGAAVVWQVTVLAQDLPEYEANIRSKLADLKQLDGTSTVDRISAAFERISADLESKKTNVIPPVPVHVENQERGIVDRAAAALTPILEPFVTAALVLVLSVFLLMKRENVRDRLIRLLGAQNLTLATKALDDAGSRISRYLLAQLCLNGLFGVLVAIGLSIIGLPFAILWGVLGAALRYIPYLGAWLSALIPIALSIVVFEGWWQPLAVIALYAVLEPLIGMVLEPIVFGHSVGISEAALLIALVFWTWIWGPVGLLLATPMTVCLVVLGEYVPYLEFFHVLLGAEPVLENKVRFYQRLLVRDVPEAAQIARAAGTPLEVCDAMIVPALAQAKRDRQAQRLSVDELDDLADDTQQVVEDVLGAEPAAEATRKRAAVLICAVNDDIDDVATRLLARQAVSSRCQTMLLGSGVLPAEVCARVAEQDVPIVCLVSVPPSPRARLRYLIKVLRRRFPELKIVVARLGSGRVAQNLTTRLTQAGADTVVGNLQKSVSCLLELATRDSYRRNGAGELVASEATREAESPA